MRTYRRTIIEKVLAGGPVESLPELDRRYELAKEGRKKWSCYSPADQGFINRFTEGQMTLKEFKAAMGFKTNNEAYRFHSQACIAKAQAIEEEEAERERQRNDARLTKENEAREEAAKEKAAAA